ncbi:type II toxin-antitoxin system YhaV family toxin [Shimia sp. R9_1]|uniref:type II toxin-antitoxin system YhaV family toxin n=1 Tax=Shimia sp. R9_1 TaxID=2821111 RepID=UPI001ADACB29|nr:type II toxin-antitoxin system YhaV family toxin [Shimia sp. R9_1]MBO9406175.1 type II toxin-antitoxin system YhaV family toxin [Shimia sp. R9_1]
MTVTPIAPLVVNGWSIFAHPLFLDQLESLISEVEARKSKDPKTYSSKNCSKRLAAILKLISTVVPADPASPTFRQGGTLGDERKHWFRAKFFQQFRLFFRFNMKDKIIVFAWVNDEDTKRAYGSKTDAYATFRSMLEDGNPPDSYDDLLIEAQTATDRFQKALADAET